MMGETPKMIPIILNGKHYTDSIKAFRVSKDGAVAGIVLKNGDIMIYRVINIKSIIISIYSCLTKREILLMKR
jgi:hypothetical protein